MIVCQWVELYRWIEVVTFAPAPSKQVTKLSDTLMPLYLNQRIEKRTVAAKGPFLISRLETHRKRWNSCIIAKISRAFRSQSGSRWRCYSFPLLSLDVSMLHVGPTMRRSRNAERYLSQSCNSTQTLKQTCEFRVAVSLP